MIDKRLDIDKEQYVWDIWLPQRRYRLDMRFILNDGRNHPLAVICPGGGYRRVSSYIEGTPVARQLNNKGISAAIVYYSVGGWNMYPAPMNDLARAVGELLYKRKIYHLDTENYSVWGFSAGGHLAASFGTENMGYEKYHLPKPGALILSYPVISMDLQITHMGSHDHLIGRNADQTLEDETSVEKHVWEGYPRTYAWCGTADESVDNQNTILLMNALGKYGIDHKGEIIEGVPHGMGPATGTTAEGWIDRAVDFWLK